MPIIIGIDSAPRIYPEIKRVIEENINNLNYLYILFSFIFFMNINDIGMEKYDKQRYILKNNKEFYFTPCFCKMFAFYPFKRKHFH